MRMALPFLLLAGCGSAVAGERIECRPAAAAGFARVCAIEVEGSLLTVRKPDGGFRRLRIARDGTGVAAADGAEPARVTVLPGNVIEVEIGGDRFRLPARVRGR